MKSGCTNALLIVGYIRRVVVEAHGLNACSSTGKTMEICCLIAEKLCLKISYGMLMHYGDHLPETHHLQW